VNLYLRDLLIVTPFSLKTENRWLRIQPTTKHVVLHSHSHRNQIHVVPSWSALASISCTYQWQVSARRWENASVLFFGLSQRFSQTWWSLRVQSRLSS